MQGVIVDFAPNERMAFHLEGDYNTADVAFTLEEDDGVGGDDDGVGDEEFKDKLGIHDVKETLEAPGAACSCTINRQSALAGPRSSRSKEVDQALADVYESYRNLKKTNGS